MWNAYCIYRNNIISLRPDKAEKDIVYDFMRIISSLNIGNRVETLQMYRIFIRFAIDSQII